MPLAREEVGEPAAATLALLLALLLLLLMGAELVVHAEDRDHALGLLAARLQRHALRRLDQPRRSLGPQQEAAQPEEEQHGQAQQGRNRATPWRLIGPRASSPLMIMSAQ